jgi:hypothetical protein
MWVDDVRRWAAVRTAGISRLLLEGDGALVDVRGAVATGDRELAAQFAWHLARVILPVSDMVNGGAVDVAGWTLSRAEPDLLHRAFDLAMAPLDDPWDGAAWLDELVECVRTVEATLELGEPLPVVRDPDQMFAGLAVAREWLELCAELGVALPAVAYQ